MSSPFFGCAPQKLCSSQSKRQQANPFAKVQFSNPLPQFQPSQHNERFLQIRAPTGVASPIFLGGQTSFSQGYGLSGGNSDASAKLPDNYEIYSERLDMADQLRELQDQQNSLLKGVIVFNYNDSSHPKDHRYSSSSSSSSSSSCSRCKDEKKKKKNH
jgi:hypothetical protein